MMATPKVSQVSVTWRQLFQPQLQCKRKTVRAPTLQTHVKTLIRARQPSCYDKQVSLNMRFISCTWDIAFAASAFRINDWNDWTSDVLCNSWVLLTIHHLCWCTMMRSLNMWTGLGETECYHSADDMLKSVMVWQLWFKDYRHLI